MGVWRKGMKRGKEGLYVHQNSVSGKGEEGGE